tara:strand:- start:249 stop:506 length:258 start_codon:yes stop_codon:yes gene_type:complete
MALTETTEYDKIEVVGEHKHIQCRKATVIKKDGKEVARSFERYVLHPDTDLSSRSEPDEVVAICNAAWTQEVKDAWTKFQASASQ